MNHQSKISRIFIILAVIGLSACQSIQDGNIKPVSSVSVGTVVR